MKGPSLEAQGQIGSRCCEAEGTSISKFQKAENPWTRVFLAAMRLSRFIIDIMILACSLTSSAANMSICYRSRVAAFLLVPFTSSYCRRRLLFSLADENEITPPSEDEQDTTRVRIWRALASRKELTLKQLGAAVGERRQGDLKAHLQHVEKQAKTLKNKNAEWRERRGLSATDTKKVNKLRIKTRRGKDNEVLVWLG